MYQRDKSMDLPEANEVPSYGLYYIKVEMVDGSSQILQISKEQATDLGIDLTDEAPEIAENGTLGTLQIVPETNRIQDETQSIIAGREQVIVDGAENITEYRVMHPVDMKLKSLKRKDFLPSRGRVKRPLDDIISIQPTKKVRTVRTRSGRITVPPKHFQQVYKRFLEDNSPSNESETEMTNMQTEQLRSPSPLVVGDFTPLRTNGDPPPSVPFQPPVSTKNKGLAGQFRCTTCNKAYIGKGKMRKHLRLFPDHTPKSKLTLADSKAWECLIDTTKMARSGHRGAKFCQELFHLLTNVKILVRYFFKLQKKLHSYDDIDYHSESNDDKNEIINDTGHYLMNELLAKVLEIDKGWYTFNENELCKDVSIFSFLENFDSTVLSALSINDQRTDNTDHILALLNDNENKLREIDDLSHRKKLTILSNVIIPSMESNDLSVLDKATKEDPIKTSEYENENHDMLSSFLNQQLVTAEKQNTIETNDKGTIEISNKQNDHNLNSSILAKDTVNKESTSNILANPKSLDNVNSDAAAVILFNSNNITENVINVEQFKYRMGELVVDNLDENPPLEIFQFDSNQ